MNGIFISYRRQDSSGWAGHLSDYLRENFGAGQVFMDIETIEPGVDFVEGINKAVGSCAALLVLIGPQWLSAADTGGRRRLDDPNDFIRLEVATALRRDIRVIPVLVGGAVMPLASDLPEDMAPLARRQAHEINDKRWEYDARLLVETLEKIGVKRLVSAPQQHTAADEHGAAAAPLAPAVLKKSKKAITAIVLAVLTLSGVFSSENRYDYNTKIGGIILALAAVVLAAIAFYEVRQKKVRSTGLAVSGLVCSGLVLLAVIGDLSSFHGSPIPPAGSGSVNLPPVAPMPLPVRPANPQPEQEGTPAYNLSGAWYSADGTTFNIQHAGNYLEVLATHPNQGVTVAGRGTVQGDTIVIEYVLNDLSTGRAQLRVAPNGREMVGTYYNATTRQSGPIRMLR